MALLLLLILGGIGFPGNDKKQGAHVQGSESGVEFMELFDLDKDGKISQDEWETVKPSTY